MEIELYKVLTSVKRAGVTAVLAGALSFVLVACGDSPGGTAGATATTGDQGQVTATAVQSGGSGSATVTTGSTDTSAATATVVTAGNAGECSKLNLNTSEGSEYLSAIPGFSQRMVREFQEYKPYDSIQQFRREIGKYVDEATVAEYEKYVFVPVKANTADAATLMQIPGVTADVAQKLAGSRPYESNEAFLAALSDAGGSVDPAAAKCYLDATP